MKRIKIQNIITPDYESVYIRDKYYCIYLGENRFFYFSNEVKARRFIAETNRFYNSALHEYNYIYTQLLIEYRNTWFYTDEKFTNRIAANISDLEKIFNLVIQKSGNSINGNPFTFQYLNKISILLHDIAISLRSVKLDKDYFHELQRIDIFINQLNSMQENIASWGKNYNGTVLDVK